MIYPQESYDETEDAYRRVLVANLTDPETLPRLNSAHALSPLWQVIGSEICYLDMTARRSLRIRRYESLKS